jgi:hypothetical protein
MSAFDRTTDSSRTPRHVRFVPQHQSWQTSFLLDLTRLRAEMSCVPHPISLPPVAGPSPTWASDFVSQM